MLELLDKGQHINELNSVFMSLFEIDEDERISHEKDRWLVQLKKIRRPKST